MKNWIGQEVLYFGDHPYSDLADVSLHHLWRTGAIIWELDVSSFINLLLKNIVLKWVRIKRVGLGNGNKLLQIVKSHKKMDDFLCNESI